MLRRIIVLSILIPAALILASKSAAAEGETAANRAELSKAKSNYQGHCSPCHGVNGDGKGDLADSLGEGVKPINHTDAKVMSARSDADIAKVISGGGESVGLNAAMPPFNTILSKEEIQGLVKYLRILCNCKHE